MYALREALRIPCEMRLRAAFSVLKSNASHRTPESTWGQCWTHGSPSDIQTAPWLCEHSRSQNISGTE